MRLPVLTAVGDPAVEASLVAAFDRPSEPVEVVRRCVDVAELLAAAAAGLGRAALVSADLRRLDRDTVVRLTAARVGVVGLVAPGDDDARARCLRLGVATVLAADSSPAEVAAALVAAATSTPAPGRRIDLADPADALDGPRLVADDDLGGGVGPGGAGPGPGRVIAVWGPTGAPGRTLVATNLAAELALLGSPSLLVDADVYGGSVAQQLGLLDEAPGLAAAARAANLGSLDVDALAAVARAVALPGPGDLRVLTGLSRPERWPELRPGSIDAVLAVARRLAATVVIDCAFCIEADEELSFDAAAPRRNGATLAALAAADVVVALGAADPVGLTRLVRGLTALREAVPGAVTAVVVNRLRAGPVPGDPAREVVAALARFAGVTPLALLPEDREAADAGVAAGRLLAEVSPAGALRAAVRSLAVELSSTRHPATPPRRARRLRRLERAGAGR